MFSSPDKLNTDYIVIVSPSPVLSQEQFITLNLKYPCVLTKSYAKSTGGTGTCTIYRYRSGIPTILFSQSITTSGNEIDFADITLQPGDSLKQVWDIVTGLTMPTVQLTAIHKR